jgi:hypothetical protein
MRLSLQSEQYCREQLSDWIAAQQVPEDPAVLVGQWWPKFKRELHLKVADLNRVAKARQAGRLRDLKAAALAALNAAQEHANSCTDAELQAALQQVADARTALAQLMNGAEALARQRRRHQWVHTGERPSPAMTRMLQPPRAANFIAGLQAPGTGHLVVDGVSLASIVGRRYADISTAPQLEQTAQQTVLEAVAQHSQRLFAEAASQLGAAGVTVEEVEDAIKGTAPGKAPGLDGIPGELYKQYRPVLAPILAQLYSAIGTLKECPPGFLDGVVIPVLKPGLLAILVDSYRPIQLLSYDYRLLAKLLANRLLTVAGGIIDPAQCAFLKNRQIGDSIRLLQMLPPLLVAENRTAIAAFLDFRKAYDTVSREFLYAVAETLGLGDGFVGWMKVVLTNTYSCSAVNGF